MSRRVMMFSNWRGNGWEGFVTDRRTARRIARDMGARFSVAKHGPQRTYHFRGLKDSWL